MNRFQTPVEDDSLMGGAAEVKQREKDLDAQLAAAQAKVLQKPNSWRKRLNLYVLRLLARVREEVKAEMARAMREAGL